MKIMDFFRKKFDVKQQEIDETNKAIEGVIESENNGDYVADISMVELEKADWDSFGYMLKENKILPNSYPRKPVRVDISLDHKNRPRVFLEFRSTTSDSVREFFLHQDHVFQYVNGSINMSNEEMVNKVWKDFQSQVKYRNKLHTYRTGTMLKRKAQKMMSTAKRMMNYENLYELEQEFFKKYKDVEFDAFRYGYFQVEDIESGDLKPAFVGIKKMPDGKVEYMGGVTPFSPKTLEFCILRMTKRLKTNEGEIMPAFEKKCRQIQDYSGYESEDWDRVIRIGKDIIKQQLIIENLKDTTYKERYL